VETPTDSSAKFDPNLGGFARSPGEVAPAPEDSPASAAPNPDNPPWGVGKALLAWLGSIGLLIFFQVVAVVVYFIYRMKTGGMPALSTPQEMEKLALDPTLILITVVLIIPAHILTFAMAWAIITGFGKRSFQQTVGWSWGAKLGFWGSAGLAVLLLIASSVVVYLGGGSETDIDKIVASSVAARYAIAFLAAATAPLIEEVIYRGILFPALRRASGMITAVVIVSILFAGVHVYQYRNSFSVIAAILLLSVTLTLTRAYTRRLLPCFVIHLVFNGIQSVIIIASPYWEKFTVAPKPQGLLAALSPYLARLLH
jgi:membrane protease YdiL (CAAX protease family)